MRIELLQKRSEIILNQVNNYNFAGNIIPHSWYRSILLEKGRPDMAAITILAEICYWYRWQYIEDSQTGEILSKKAKFQADLLQRNIDSLQQKFGFSKRGITDALTRLEKAKLVFRELRTVKTKHGNYGNVLFLAPRMKNIVKLDSCIPLTQKTAQGYVKNDDGEGNQGFPDPSRKKQHKLTQKPTQAYAENCVTYTKITSKTATKKKTAAKNNQESKRAEEGQAQPAAAFSCANAQNTKENATAQDGVIAEILTTKQYEHVAQLAAELNEANAALGVTARDIEALLLDRKRFSKAGRDFFRKFNTIRAQALKGNFTSPGSVQKAAVEIDEKVQAKKAADDKLAKLLADKHSLECALRSKAAQLSPVLAESHRSAIAGIDAEIAKLQLCTDYGLSFHHSISLQKDSQLIGDPALGGSACGNDMCSSSFGSAASFSSGGVS